ncbi:methyltransferase domain-containing protein [Melittangium boletus]|uniref:class I SAM-dependent DNA methyltransferase n=1 Tax=Melittangium boletus TaxID=83453 RepID=UPI003DA3AC43
MTPPSVDWRARLEALGISEGADVPASLGAQLLRSWGEPLAAEAALREHLELQPEDKDALKTLVAVLRELGRADEESTVRRHLLERRCEQLGVPAQERDAVAAYLEAAETGLGSPARSVAAYVTALFNVYAPSFDDSLRGLLAYRAPECLMEAVQEVLGPRRHLDVLDLGCGTGLAGPLLRPLARRLEGLDLSPLMIDKARERRVYDSLWVAEISADLEAGTSRYDLITAVDVLVYFGALEAVMGGVARRLAPGGVFAFTVEKGEAPGYRLQPSARYAHHLDYVRRCAHDAGLRPVVEWERSLRRQAGQPVQGHVVVLAGR